jgi:mRNA interferase MazF
VVLVPFDFTDRSGTKVRPAVVVSTDHYNQQSPDVLIASITGNLNPLPHPGDYPIAAWSRAGLRVPSLVQMKLATIDNHLVVRKLGALGKADLTGLERGVRQALGL